MATTARIGGTRLGQRRQIEALVAPTGEEHDRVEAGHRGERGVGRGGLGVVVPAHPVGLGDELHAVGQAGEGPQHVAHGVEVGPRGHRGHRRGQSVGDVVGQGAGQLVDAQDRGCRRAGRARPDSTVASAPEPSGPKVTVSTAALRLASTTASVALATARPWSSVRSDQMRALAAS